MGYLGKDKAINFLHAESEKMFRHFVENQRMGAYAADNEGNLVYINSAFVNILGYQNKDEVLGLNLPNQLYVNPKDREDFLKAMKNTGFVRDYVVKNKRKDGSVVILSATSNYIRNEKEEVVGVQGVVEDITEKMKMEERLKVEKSKLAEIISFDEKASKIRQFDQLFDFVVVKTSMILEAEKCTAMLVDEYHQQLCLKGAKGLGDANIIKTDSDATNPFIANVVEKGIPLLIEDAENDKRYKNIDAQFFLGRSFMVVPVLLDGHVIGAIAVADKNVPHEGKRSFNELDLKILCTISREVAIAVENVGLYKELDHLTVTDPLTQIFNLRKFKKSLHHEINRVSRFSAPLCLMMIDVDDLKSYNDTFGHVEGSNLLKEMSAVLTKNLREIDIACRYGGDEFAVILPETDVLGAKVAADKIVDEFKKCSFKKKVTISIGLAQREDKMTGQELIEKADKALYEAKEKGKNQVRVYK